MTINHEEIQANIRKLMAETMRIHDGNVELHRYESSGAPQTFFACALLLSAVGAGAALVALFLLFIPPC